MNRIAYGRLVIRALCELARFDVDHAVRGFAGVHRRLVMDSASASATGAKEAVICDALVLATCLYWKPVLCLQRSVCAVRLLRRYGLAAHLVIGYRPVPFVAHAWVEVDGRVVNDSPAYRERLRILYTI